MFDLTPPKPAPLEKEQEGYDGIAHDMEKLRLGLENCRLLAARHRKEDWALLILGFCAEAGVVRSITRSHPA